MLVESHRGHLRFSEVDEPVGVVTVEEEGDGDGDGEGEGEEGREGGADEIPKTLLLTGSFDLSPPISPAAASPNSS